MLIHNETNISQQVIQGKFGQSMAHNKRVVTCPSPWSPDLEPGPLDWAKNLPKRE